MLPSCGQISLECTWVRRCLGGISISRNCLVQGIGLRIDLAENKSWNGWMLQHFWLACGSYKNTSIKLPSEYSYLTKHGGVALVDSVISVASPETCEEQHGRVKTIQASTCAHIAQTQIWRVGKDGSTPIGSLPFEALTKPSTRIYHPKT